jgi:hypothetical protein
VRLETSSLTLLLKEKGTTHRPEEQTFFFSSVSTKVEKYSISWPPSSLEKDKRMR